LPFYRGRGAPRRRLLGVTAGVNGLMPLMAGGIKEGGFKGEIKAGE
jgi:hypothetical protein